MWWIIWIALCIVCAVLGSERNIGGVAAFFASLFLSPLIGFIIVMASDKKSTAPKTFKWQQLVEQAELEKYKGNIDLAIERYKEAKFYLEKDFEAKKNHTHLRLKYIERIDGLRMIIDKLIAEKADAKKSE